MDTIIAQQYIWKIAYRLVAEEEYTVLGSGEGIIELLRQKGRELHYIQIRLADFLWSATLEYDLKD
ncbi:hypothetical protein, partial [Acinetobacter baumannii]|uniref:hypothetical protein n=1 Tax=Acinetobacter baumannii TaxID=470 RepID=UPI001969D179